MFNYGSEGSFYFESIFYPIKSDILSLSNFQKYFLCSYLFQIDQSLEKILKLYAVFIENQKKKQHCLTFSFFNQTDLLKLTKYLRISTLISKKNIKFN